MGRCRICATANGTTLAAREMMFGFRDEFEYFQCDNCGSVSLNHDLSELDLQKYYPLNYYSFATPPKTRLRRWLIRQRDRRAMHQSNVIDSCISRLKPNPVLNLLCGHGVQSHHRILDVGCGAGTWLSSLANAGFRHLSGVDPFIAEDISLSDGVTIRKARISEVEGLYDVITFHHSLEHVPDPVTVVQMAANHLRSGGICLVRVPTVSSEAWDRYGPDWVQLDAPRHFAVPSRKGIGILADAAGLAVETVVDDSSELQFYGSEQYRRGISLNDPRSYAVNPDSSIFSPGEMRAFRKCAVHLNAQSRGDQAAFLLRRH